MENDNRIILNDEEGNAVAFEFLDLIEYSGKEYVVLLPEEESDGEVVILQVDDAEDSDGESYMSVDSEELLGILFNIFKERFKDEFNFTD